MIVSSLVFLIKRSYVDQKFFFSRSSEMRLINKRSAALFGVCFLIFFLAYASGFSRNLPLETIKLPKGYSISIFADNVDNARSMTLAPDGTLFVGTRNDDRVYALKDLDGDGKSDVRFVIARDLYMPNGVAFKNGDLYVAEVNRILRFDDILSNPSDPPLPVVVKDDFPTDRAHGWKFIRFGPDGKLYVPVGAPCNVCERPDSRYASITRMSSDGSNFEIVAQGVRNTVGFDWNPLTGELWFTDNGRDRLGDDLPPDELNRAPEAGLHFGFPYCHGKNIADPKFGQNVSCEEFQQPAIELGPHVAALGMRFYRGTMFPSEMQNQIFIAEHGSWNRSIPIGYRITLVRVRGDRAVSYEVFAEGWLQNGRAWGRPVDVEVMEDGSLLVSDDRAGVIYRITYSE
jgi:glucose/arabinose dehydrogenase